jgi:hypothetical protein
LTASLKLRRTFSSVKKISEINKPTHRGLPRAPGKSEGAGADADE